MRAPAAYSWHLSKRPHRFQSATPAQAPLSACGAFDQLLPYAGTWTGRRTSRPLGKPGRRLGGLLVIVGTTQRGPTTAPRQGQTGGPQREGGRELRPRDRRSLSHCDMLVYYVSSWTLQSLCEWRNTPVLIHKRHSRLYLDPGLHGCDPGRPVRVPRLINTNSRNSRIKPANSRQPCQTLVPFKYTIQAELLVS